MKKKIIALLLTIISTQAFSEDLHKHIKNFGYTQDYIYENSPRHNMSQALFQSTLDAKAETSHTKNNLQTADFLKPRVYSTSESSEMIPLLLKLQKQNPTSVKLTRKLAPTCLNAGQTREALYWYTQTYLRDRADIESLWNMASLAHSLGMKDKAKQYLEEYAKVDPNSSWGRMAKEFLNGEYSNNMKDGFKGGLSRIGSVSAGSSNNDAGILVVEGRSTDIETFATDYQPRLPAEPIDLFTGKAKIVESKLANSKRAKKAAKATKATKAKMNKRKDKRKPKLEKAGSLGKATITTDNLTVKAEPLQ